LILVVIGYESDLHCHWLKEMIFLLVESYRVCSLQCVQY